jgi:hypothetical protein
MSDESKMHDEEQHAEDESVEETYDRHDGYGPEREGYQERQYKEGRLARRAGYLDPVIETDSGMRHAGPRG